jgi:hypothetical protein
MKSRVLTEEGIARCKALFQAKSGSAPSSRRLQGLALRPSALRSGQRPVSGRAIVRWLDGAMVLESAATGFGCQLGWCSGAARGEPEPRRHIANSLAAVTKARRFAMWERARCARRSLAGRATCGQCSPQTTWFLHRLLGRRPSTRREVGGGDGRIRAPPRRFATAARRIPRRGAGNFNEGVPPSSSPAVRIRPEPLSQWWSSRRGDTRLEWFRGGQ